jgi:ubiquinone/menaquinone biosynthesis C-methylase UbiE
MTTPELNRANVDRFSGFADVYDRYRPQPPMVLVDLLCQVAQIDRPRLVVDLGSGTGLSTSLWADRAEQVIGVEPSGDMRRQAERRIEQAGMPSVRFLDGSSSATGLQDACADIVTASQALHWMEPQSTFAEVARLLRPGGVFASIDCDWPPTVQWEVEAAFNTCMERAPILEQKYGLSREVVRWLKHEHLQRMRESGCFRFVKEVVVQHQEPGDAERIVGVALSQGGIAGLLKHGVSEAEIGVAALRDVAERVMGSEVWPWYWSYRVRIGIV